MSSKDSSIAYCEMPAASSSRLPPLVPRVSAKPTAPVKTERVLEIQHGDKEWRAVYPHLERMYVRERRKLRYVMAKMEDTYGFKATYETPLIPLSPV